jgi:hypothetical protein
MLDADGTVRHLATLHRDCGQLAGGLGTARKPDREAQVIASNATRDLVNLDWGEQPAQGAGETVDPARLNRILTHYGYTGDTNLDPSVITLQATTLAQSAWELIGRATDDELGAVWLDESNVLQFRNRNTWLTPDGPSPLCRLS